MIGLAAKIGILGESTSASPATVTVYTVPASKAARVRILFWVEASGGNVEWVVSIGTPGTEWNIVRAVATGWDVFTGIPDGANMQADAIGIIDEATTGGLDTDNGERSSLTPFPVDYYLSTGDTVVFKTQGDFIADLLFQVQGIEDDA